MKGTDVHEYCRGKRDKKSIIDKCEQDDENHILISDQLKL